MHPVTRSSCVRHGFWASVQAKTTGIFFVLYLQLDARPAFRRCPAGVELASFERRSNTQTINVMEFVYIQDFIRIFGRFCRLDYSHSRTLMLTLVQNKYTFDPAAVKCQPSQICRRRSLSMRTYCNPFVEKSK